jgi:hypothetical protein
MTRHFLFLSLVSLLTLAGCKSGAYHPDIPFAEMEAPAPPDYSKMESWAAHPTKRDSADALPKGSGLSDDQAQAKVDVFFIHPTVLNSKEAWNGNFADPKLNEDICKSTIRFQASLFNGVGRVYAPHYREATLGTFHLTDRRAMVPPIMLAYGDVRLAFEYYLEHENKGRPIILAGHSQGTVHGIHLLKEFFDGKPLADQLVAAYLPGWPIPADTFQVLKGCDSPDGTGCVCTWMTCQEGFTPDWLKTDQQRLGINPVAWNTQGDRTDAALAKGAVLWRYDFRPGIVDPRMENGMVWIHKPDVPGKALYREKNYHVGDFNLFWMDVRENAQLRVDAYLKAHGK